MVSLRAFCLEQAVKLKSSSWVDGRSTVKDCVELAAVYERYILGDANLAKQPVISVGASTNIIHEVNGTLKI